MRRPFGARKHVVTTPLIPPPGAKATGEVVPYAGSERQVYRRLKPIDLRSRVIELKDESGKVVYQPAPQGATPRPVRQREVVIPDDHPDAFEEFVLYDDGTGGVHLVFDFREDAELMARKAREAERKAKIDSILDSLADADPGVIARVLAESKGKKADEPGFDKTMEGDEPPFRLKRQVPGAGYWVVDGEDEPVNEEPMPKDRAQALLDSLLQPTLNG